MGLTLFVLLSLFPNYCVIIVILRRWVVDSLKPDSKTDKRPFAEKHPKLNFLFGLLLLLFLIMAFGYAMYMIGKYWCCTIKVDIENSKGQYIEKDKQEATKDGSESTKIQHGI